MDKCVTENRLTEICNALSQVDAELVECLNEREYSTTLVRMQVETFGLIPSSLEQRLAALESRELRLRSQRALLEAEAIFLDRVRTVAPAASPRLGERILLLVLTKEERVNIPGDLEEEYQGIAAKQGERFAKIWYYKQVAASAWPMIRKAVRWGALASVGEWIRRII